MRSIPVAGFAVPLLVLGCHAASPKPDPGPGVAGSGGAAALDGAGAGGAGGAVGSAGGAGPADTRAADARSSGSEVAPPLDVAPVVPPGGDAAAGSPVAVGGTAGLEMFASVPDSTGEKPQSKLWHHDGSYWAALQGPDGVAIYERKGTVWVRGPVLGPRGNADVKWNGADLFVLVYTTASKLHKFTYDRAARAWVAAAGFPVDVPTPTGAETMVIDQDGTGRLWATAEGDGTIQVRHTTSPDHRTWSAQPVVLETGVDPDDISAVVAFGGKSVGVMWSDQIRWRFGFRVHEDGAAPETWSATEVVYAGTGQSDDHIHLAFDSQGRVYAVTKDAKDKFAVHRRASDGTWTSKADVAGGTGTRPIIMISEADAKAYVVYTRWGIIPYRIEHRVANLADLIFGSETVFMTSPTNVTNVTGMKQLLPRGSLIAAAENGSKALFNAFGPGPAP